MENKFQTSFIPRNQGPTAGGASAYKKPISVLSIIATIILIITALTCGALFLYKSFLNKNIERITEELALVRESIDSTAVTRLLELDAQMKSARMVIGNHLVPSKIFDLIALNTVTTVRLRDLKYSALPGNKASITLKGEAQSYAVLATEAKILKSKTGISNVSFVDFSLTDKGTIAFTATMDVASSVFQYNASASSSAVPVTSTVLDTATTTEDNTVSTQN